MEAVDAIVPVAMEDPGGVKWLLIFYGCRDIYDYFKSLPSVVKRNGVYYNKVSCNSDFGNINYREVAESDLAFPVR